jgi:hypothetical protein
MPMLQRTIVDESPVHRPLGGDELLTMASRELVAFQRAVSELCGSETATLATEDWFEELAIRENVCDFTGDDWRLLTMAASARFARRLVDPVQRCFGDSLTETKLSTEAAIQ